MGRPSLSPLHNVEVPINLLIKNLISLWNRSFKIVQIQSKSNINQRLNNKLKDPSIMEGGGGEEWAGPVFPHPTM